MEYVTYVLCMIPGAVIAIVVHEYVKALVSTRLGDPLPKKNGRLTLNPLKHLDPIGFLFIVFYDFGWGRPVDTSQMYYRDKKKDTLAVHATPAIVNIVLGMTFAMLLYVLKRSLVSLPSTHSQMDKSFDMLRLAYRIVYGISRYNLTLAFFNLIPIYPLDGAEILRLYISPGNAFRLNSMRSLFQLILLILLFGGVVGAVINPVVDLMIKFAYF